MVRSTTVTLCMLLIGALAGCGILPEPMKPQSIDELLQKAAAIPDPQFRPLSPPNPAVQPPEGDKDPHEDDIWSWRVTLRFEYRGWDNPLRRFRVSAGAAGIGGSRTWDGNILRLNPVFENTWAQDEAYTFLLSQQPMCVVSATLAPIPGTRGLYPVPRRPEGPVNPGALRSTKKRSSTSWSYGIPQSRHASSAGAARKSAWATRVGRRDNWST